MRRTSLKLKHWNSFAMLKNVLMMLKQFQCFISVLFHHVRRALDDGQPKRDPCMIHTQSHRLMLSSFNSARSRRASEMWMYYVNIFVNLELVIEVTLLDVNWWSFFGIGCVDPGGQYFAKGAMHQSCPPIITLQNIHPCESVIKIMKCPYCLNCPKFGQLGLIIRKIIRIVATRCQIFLVKNVQNSISLRPRPHFGSLQCPLTFWLHLRGPTVKGRERRRGKVNEAEKEGQKRSAPPPQKKKKNHHGSIVLRTIDDQHCLVWDWTVADDDYAHAHRASRQSYICMRRFRSVVTDVVDDRSRNWDPQMRTCMGL